MLKKLINVLIDSRKIAQRLDRFFESAEAQPRSIQKIGRAAVQFSVNRIKIVDQFIQPVHMPAFGVCEATTHLTVQ